MIARSQANARRPRKPVGVNSSGPTPARRRRGQGGLAPGVDDRYSPALRDPNPARPPGGCGMSRRADGSRGMIANSSPARVSQGIGRPLGSGSRHRALVRCKHANFTARSAHGAGKVGCDGRAPQPLWLSATPTDRLTIAGIPSHIAFLAGLRTIRARSEKLPSCGFMSFISGSARHHRRRPSANGAGLPRLPGESPHG